MRLVGIFVLFGLGGACQQNRAVVRRGMCPLKGGIIKRYERKYNYGDRMIGETIFGEDSTVRAVQDGIVEAILPLGDVKAVILYGGFLFYTYANLDTILVHKAQFVHSGEVIGICGGKELDFVVSDSTGTQYSPAKYIHCEVKIIKEP